ncbi:MAG TPA: hypothetical protein VLE19_00560 [Pyrinomonadaceae bacterium]|nr:hypothetical protein [Pyrinomonadaceae bacterium]
MGRGSFAGAGAFVGAGFLGAVELVWALRAADRHNHVTVKNTLRMNLADNIILKT